jgi:hypothetical protein
VTRSSGDDRSPEEDTLAWLKLTATTADEAAHWLRNSLVRLRIGHELDYEIQSAEQALQVAIERISRNAPEGISESQIRTDGGRVYCSQGLRERAKSSAVSGETIRPTIRRPSITTRVGTASTRKRSARSGRSLTSTLTTSNLERFFRRCKIWARCASVRRH